MLRPLDLTTALRPSLLPDETLLFVQDAVGLYGGKAKLADYQNGQAYLTSHRVCYIDNNAPRERAVAIDLKDVEHTELYAKFLRSSPKIVLIPKSAKFGHLGTRGQSQSPAAGTSSTDSPVLSSLSQVSKPSLKDATWVCPICSFSNAVPSRFDPSLSNSNTPLPPCQACGIKPPLAHIVKAAITNLSTQRRGQRPSLGGDGASSNAIVSVDESAGGARCPRCTFQNHPSLTVCEMCGTYLDNSNQNRADGTHIPGSPSRSSSPAIANSQGVPFLEPQEEVKLSFRSGGEKTFHERLRNALKQRKWLSSSAPPVPKSEELVSNNTDAQKEATKVGIAGLERRGLEMRKNNEFVIGNAFEDLAALMASAKDIIALAESLSSQSQTNGATTDGLQSSADPSVLLSQLNLTTTKDMLSSKSTSANLYLTELCRSIAEFLTDDRRAILKSAGGVMSLVDLWAVFNRARGGVELVSPSDFEAAAQLFDKLSLPVRLRRFKSGLLVVQDRSRTDEKTVKALTDWLLTLKEEQPAIEVTWDWKTWGRGITAQETAERFGWSIGVASEELEMAEEQGVLCRESGIEGVKFWQNHLGQAQVVDFQALAEEERSRVIMENLRQVGLS